MNKCIRINRKTWEKLACSIGISVGVAALVSHGLDYAKVVEATADLSSGRLYERIEPGGILLRRYLGDWSTAWIHWFWLAWGVAVAWAAMTRTTKRKAVWTVGLGITFGWMGLGAWYWANEGTLEQFGGDILLNITAGLIGSAIFLLAVVTEEELWQEKEGADGTRRTGYKFGAIGGIYCLVVMVGMYYAVGVFVQVRKVDIRVAAQPPLQVVAGGKTWKKEEFNFGGTGKDGETNEVSVIYGDGLTWVWEAKGDQETRKVFVVALGECYSIEEASTKAEEIGEIQSDRVQRVEVRNKARILNSTIRGKQKTIEVEGDELRVVWIGEEDSDGKRGLKEFLSGKHDVVGSTEGVLEFFSNTLTLRREEAEKLEAVDVIWEVTLDDVVHTIRMPPRKLESLEDSRETCKAVEMSKHQDRVVTGEVGLGGLYLRVDPTDSSEWNRGRTDGSWRFGKPSGWVEFGQRTRDELSRALRSQIGAIWIENGVEDVFIDWRKAEIPMEARFRGHGDASVWYSNEGRVITEGSFHAAWLGGGRINRTTWESMSTEIRGMVVTGVVTVLAAVVTIVYRRRKRWLEAWRAPLD